MTEHQKKAMIISVGGTTEPIVASICACGPEFISFLASQESCAKIPECLRDAKEKSGRLASFEQTLVDDVNDLVHCYGKAEEAVQRVLAKGYPGSEVMVDYTGGTKNMTAALTLAAVSHGFSFSSVGGRERTKEGLGIVKDGSEEVRRSLNPWDIMGIEARRDIALLFNQFQFTAAQERIAGLKGKNVRFPSRYEKLGFMVEGFQLWDLFRHSEAQQRFSRARLEELAELDDIFFRQPALATLKLLPFLQKLTEDKKKNPISLCLLDLYANAERRFQEGKIDDAVLRLYRVVEMAAQARLVTAWSIDTSNVDRTRIPETVRAEYIKRYAAPDGQIKISQAAAFRLLEALGDELGRTFSQHEQKFKNIQKARNDSYLAHGFQSIGQNAFQSLREFVLTLKLFDPADLPVFPRFDVAFSGTKETVGPGPGACNVATGAIVCCGW